MPRVNILERLERGADKFTRRNRPRKEKSFGEEVKELRASLGLTQEAFCKRYYIPLANLRNWEQAAKNVTPDTAARLLIDMIRVEPERVAKIVDKARESSQSVRTFEVA